MFLKAKYLWIAWLVGVVYTFTQSYRDVNEVFAFLILNICLFTVIQIIISRVIDRLRYMALPALKADKELLYDILTLAAEFVKKSQGNDSAVYEFEALSNRLREDYGPRRTAKFMLFFKNKLEEENDVRLICKRIDYNHTAEFKKQALYVLIDIAVADKIMDEVELQFIHYVRKCLGLHEYFVKQALASHKFKFAYNEQSHQKQSNYQKPNYNSSLLKNAYEVLGITQSASINAIKKAYRKLAKQNHPDKFAHLGSFYQNQANDKFQIIANAYEIIKKQRLIK